MAAAVVASVSAVCMSHQGNAGIRLVNPHSVGYRDTLAAESAEWNDKFNARHSVIQSSRPWPQLHMTKVEVLELSSATRSNSLE